jgi:uncharacterized protein with FMN-binding domain
MTAKENLKQEGKRKVTCCLIVPLIFSVPLAVGGGVGWSLLMKEHHEAASLPLDAVDFHRLNDGTYHGVYAGGIYKWRANARDVTVTNRRVTAIQLSGSNDPGAKTTDLEMLYDRVVEAQSLQVDTISGATLTSKAYLQCIENALIPAQHP